MAKHLSPSEPAATGEPHIMVPALTRLWTTFSLETQVVAKSLETPDLVNINAMTVNYDDIVELLRLANVYGIGIEAEAEVASDRDAIVDKLLTKAETADE